LQDVREGGGKLKKKGKKDFNGWVLAPEGETGSPRNCERKKGTRRHSVKPSELRSYGGFKALQGEKESRRPIEGRETERSRST